MFNKMDSGTNHFTIKIPLVLRSMVKAEAEERDIKMSELLTDILAGTDISCAGYHAPTFDNDSPACYLSADVSKDSWLKFKKVSRG